ncbi:MAG: MFS transporter [Thermomicrobiales bacterium]|jgi:MFS family permease|nr:MFS transporter [Chloroflexota bacterium]
MDIDRRTQQRASRRALLLPVYVPTALLGFAEGLLLPTLPAFALSFDVSFAVASLVLAAAGIGTLIADLPAGMLLGRVGLKPTMLLGAALVGFGTLALVAATSVNQLIALRLLAGVGTAMWGLSRHAFITEAIDPRQRGRAISVFGGINRIGVFGGPAIGGLIGTWFGLTASFLVAGLLGIVALIVSWIFVQDTHVAVHAERHVRWALVREMVRSSWRDLSAASVAQTFAQMIRAGRQTIIPFYGLAILGLNAGQVGLIQSASSSVDMILFIPAGYLMDRFGRKVAAVPSFAIMAVGMVLIPFTTDYLTLMAAATIIGLGNGLGTGTMMTLGADLAPPGATGEFLGLWRLIGDTGRAGGPLAVGSLTDAVGFEYTSFILAGVGLSASLILALLVRETRVADDTAFGTGAPPGG